MNYQLDIIQLRALEASKDEPNFFYAMHMGQGKTLVALDDFWRWFRAGKGTRMFVCCPNSFKGGWEEEVRKHGFAFDVHLYRTGSKASRAWLNKKYDRPPLLVINYEALRADTTYEEIVKWCNAKPTFGVWDESIKLKNAQGKTTKRAIKLAYSFAAARALSGKYTTQGPHDLWGQFRALRLLPNFNFWAFKTRYCKMGGWMNKQVVGTQNADDLARWIEPYMFQTAPTTKAEEMESRFVQRAYSLTEAMEAMYMQMMHEFVLWLGSGEVVTVELAITKYMKLAQIQAGFIIKENGDIEDLVSLDNNPRVNVLRELLAEEISGKACIAYRHVYSYHLLMAALSEYKPAYITGGMPPQAIQEQLDRFHGDPECRIILLQTAAAKYGFTLLGDQSTPANACYTMVFYENTYSLDDRAQLEARIDRRGQTFRCLYVDLVGTEIDRDCIDALIRKESMYQAIFHLIKTTAVKVA